MIEFIPKYRIDATLRTISYTTESNLDVVTSNEYYERDLNYNIIKLYLPKCRHVVNVTVCYDMFNNFSIAIQSPKDLYNKGFGKKVAFIKYANGKTYNFDRVNGNWNKLKERVILLLTLNGSKTIPSFIRDEFFIPVNNDTIIEHTERITLH